MSILLNFRSKQACKIKANRLPSLVYSQLTTCNFEKQIRLIGYLVNRLIVFTNRYQIND